MKIDKSLKEVWSWKDEIYRKTKEIRIKRINSFSEELLLCMIK